MSIFVKNSQSLLEYPKKNLGSTAALLAKIQFSGYIFIIKILIINQFDITT